ncbi:hypothetical protein [Psychromicrobium lacuslunae]|uniref:Alkaline shock response membrane anchor protein AmaP n=1 Tax=Psychromicrobium lacuslunae TaxID=1618207 RepID=A0A0D4C2P6_9MICC|nr:hypothetical protein [Psychromicrobium lacuslunae]AJT42626.1 hypothetical protein UM93_16175 [Psychromicrobium lacuslunae]
MSNTNRGLNRVLLFIVSIVLLAAGVATVLAGSWSKAKDSWLNWGGQAKEFTSQQLSTTRVQLGDWEVSWLWLGLLAMLLLAVILLICWIASQGGGRTSRLSRERDPEGTLTLHDNIAQSAIKAALAEDPRVLSTTVSAWQLKKQSGLKVSIQARKGSSPRQLADSAENLVIGLDRLLGRELPILISIHSGARSGWSHQHRVQ